MNKQHKRIIFGLKVKQLRMQNELSFQELSAESGVSVSYLNEIEKGKKYPKDDKIHSLSKALDTSYEELTSDKLPSRLQPVADLLQSNFLNELPLDLFGIEAGKVVEIIANAPARVGAFISALLEIARNHALKQENFYFAALRSYQELHNNHFEELEEAANQFREDFGLPAVRIPVEQLFRVLRQSYGYSIDVGGVNELEHLSDMRSVLIPKSRKLLIHGELTNEQKAFLSAKELGWNFLKVKNRIYTSTFLHVESFEQVLSNFKASYFAGALIMNQHILREDLEDFFFSEKWNAASFLEIMDKYQASPEMFLQRLSSMLPRYFGIDQLFFLRFNTPPGSEYYTLTKELHLRRQHQPHGSALEEHYCRRWITVWLLKDLYRVMESGNYKGPIAGVQRSQFVGTDDEYLCITLARPGHPTPNTNISVTIGFLLDENAKSKIRFWNDPDIPVRQVNNTCERCTIQDCYERVAPAVHIKDRDMIRAKEEELRRLSGL
ncbi:MAG: helix-turn-helix domain-containing protein [Bacteroidota bacterium]